MGMEKTRIRLGNERFGVLKGHDVMRWERWIRWGQEKQLSKG